LIAAGAKPTVSTGMGSRVRRQPRTEAFWPTEDQEILLRAAVSRGRSALDAWETWKSRNDLAQPHLDTGSFRLLPMVYRNLVAHGADDRLMTRLKGIYRFSWCANQQLFLAAARLLQGLHEAGIGTMVLKGAALSALYYQDRGARPMSDVDVLVPLQQAVAAIACFTRMGWRPSSRLLAEDLRFRHAKQLLSDGGPEFDLHWHAFYQCLQEDADDSFWRRAVPIAILDVRTLALDPTDALLHTVVHGMAWNPLPSIRWIPDAMTILRSAGPRVDWDRLLEQAEERQLLLRFGRGVKYLRDTFEAPVPDDVIARLSGRRPSYVERVEYHYLALGERSERYYRFVIIVIVEYLRFAAGRSLFRKAMGLAEYLRYRLAVQSGTQLLGLVLRSAVRKAWMMLVPRPVTDEQT
jgi:hypothetical protein